MSASVFIVSGNDIQYKWLFDLPQKVIVATELKFIPRKRWKRLELVVDVKLQGFYPDRCPLLEEFYTNVYEILVDEATATARDLQQCIVAIFDYISSIFEVIYKEKKGVFCLELPSRQKYRLQLQNCAAWFNEQLQAGSVPA
jgi:hypothetical protein